MKIIKYMLVLLLFCFISCDRNIVTQKKVDSKIIDDSYVIKQKCINGALYYVFEFDGEGNVVLPAFVHSNYGLDICSCK